MGKNRKNKISIYIYHPENDRREQLRQAVNNIIVFEDLNMAVTAVGKRVSGIPEKIRQQKDIGAYIIYFDIENDTRGMDLAYRIRELDPWGFMICIYSQKRRQEEYFYCVNQYRLRLMECIFMDEHLYWEEKIRDCIMEIWKSYFSVHSAVNSALCEKTKEGMERIKMDRILYIESDVRPHWITVCHEKGEIRLRKTLKEVEKKLDARFVRCHRSFIVNMNYIQKICKKEKSILLSNQKILYYADKQKKFLLKKIQEFETGKSLFTVAD